MCLLCGDGSDTVSPRRRVRLRWLFCESLHAPATGAEIVSVTTAEDYRSSTSPAGVFRIATRAGAADGATARSSASILNAVRTAAGLGCSARRSTSITPCGADTAGCGLDPQSMRNGTMPPGAMIGSVRVQRRMTPSGRVLLPETTAPRRAAAFEPGAASACKSVAFAAQVANRGRLSSSMPNHRGRDGVGCDESGPMISRYERGPSAINAFLVPRPSWRPPAAARTPRRVARSSTVSSTSGVA